MRQASIYFFFVIASCILCAAASPVCTPPPALQTKLQAHPTAETYAEVGMWYANHDKYVCAVEAYRSAVKQDPKSAEFWYELGLNLLRNHNFNGAVQPLQKSVELNSAVLKPHLLLATALEELHRGPQARAEWAAALKIDPHSDMALEGASKNLLATHEFDAVIALLAPQPKAEGLVLDLASAYQGEGSTDQAVEVLKKGLEANPKSRPLTRELIGYLAMQGRYQEAAQYGKDLVAQSPRDLDAQVLYLHVLVLNDDENLARPLAKKLLATAPHNFGVLYLNGILENRTGNYADGRKFLEEAVALNPTHNNCRYNLGIALANLGDAKGAREQFEKALALGNSEPAVRFEYAKVLRTLGETQLAAEQLKLYQQEQKSKADRTLAASKMAQADQELQHGDPKKAASLYRDAIAAVPDYAMLQYKLSVALDQSGDTAGERAALEEAVKIDPSMAIAHRQLGYLAFHEGDFTTAEEQFREAVKAAPGFVDAWVSLAATLATESRHQEAKEAVQRALTIDPQNKDAVALEKDLAKTASSPADQ